MPKKLTKKQQFFKEISKIVTANAIGNNYKIILDKIGKDIETFLETQTILKKIPKDKEISKGIYSTFLNLKLEDENFIKRASSIEDLIDKLEKFFRGLMVYGSRNYASSISNVLEYKDWVITTNLIPNVKEAYYNVFPEQKKKNDLLKQIVGLSKVLKASHDEDVEELMNFKIEKLRKLTNDFSLEEMIRLEEVENLIDSRWLQ